MNETGKGGDSIKCPYFRFYYEEVHVASPQSQTFATFVSLDIMILTGTWLKNCK
jgi:hypothetical protein